MKYSSFKFNLSGDSIIREFSIYDTLRHTLIWVGSLSDLPDLPDSYVVDNTYCPKLILAFAGTGVKVV